MDEYINREAVYEYFDKCTSENPKWTPSRVKTLISRQKAADVARCGMGGGLSERNILLAQCMTALFAIIAFLTTGILGTTAQTAAQRWMRRCDDDSN